MSNNRRLKSFADFYTKLHKSRRRISTQDGRDWNLREMKHGTIVNPRPILITENNWINFVNFFISFLLVV